MKPVLYRYKDTESVVRAMDGYTPGDSWVPLFEAPATAPKHRTVSDDLIACLRGGRQCDADGVEVIMSRQACREAADILESWAIDQAPATAPSQPSWQDAINAAIPAMREYARKNPKHYFGPSLQDPSGAHAWLAKYDPQWRDSP